MDKMKTNQDGGSVTAKDSSAAGKQLEKNQKGAAKYKHGAADGHMKGENKEGAAKYKGAHDYDTSKGSHGHDSKGGHGAAKMGYTQSFGAARMNGYAKGAAKVANIMSFGASKYMKHGAADTGHGGPEGHTHPTMTLQSRETSGGGSSSSSSNTTGGESSSSSSSSSSKPLRTREEAFQNRGSQYANMNRDQYNVEIDKYNARKKKEKSSAANSISSNSSSNTTNAGSSTTTSNTTTSPNSMAETLLQGNIQAENRKQQFNFDKEEANIRAANDSITASNKMLNRLPRFRQNTPAGQNIAGRAGGRAAASTRRDSGLFSREEIAQIYQDGQDK